MMGYRATRDAEGVLTIHRVPIFVECVRGDFDADADWIKSAVSNARAAEAEGYLPPLHIRHHESDVEVRAAGFFRVVDVAPITFKGGTRLAVFADLIITDPTAQGEVLNKRLPYRSVEIFDVSKPAINSLALLDHEAPYLELPMLMVRSVDDHGAVPTQALAYTRVAKPWRASTAQVADVACFRLGAHAHLLFQDAPMNSEKKDDGVEPKKPDEEMSADSEGEETPEGEETTSEVDAICDMIRSGAITVADLQAVIAAIEERKAASAGDVDESETPAPAHVPGEAMKKEDSDSALKFAAVTGELEALKAHVKERDAAEARRNDVDEALQRLAGRPLGSDLKGKLTEFHQKHGPEAFKAHVDAQVAAFASFGAIGSADGVGKKADVPDLALKFQAKGADAVDKASRFCAEYAELAKHGAVRMTRDRYVEIQMSRAGVGLN